MRDGARIAVDVYAPPAKGPTIVRQTRYLRSVASPRPLESIARTFDLYARTREVFLGAGYGWLDVDVRGTGASTGEWLCPWSPDEVRDGAEVCDWIVKQPWSDGTIGSLGISYDGTCADMLATQKHPAVRAVAPLFALYDVYTDVAFPGGVQLQWFTERWAAYNAALDRNAFAEGFASTLWVLARAGAASPAPFGIERVLAPLASGGETSFRKLVVPTIGALFRGVRPIDSGSIAEAIADRARNMDVHRVAKLVTFRDDAGASEAYPEATVDTFSPHAYQHDARASGAAIYSYTGWRDGAYPHSAVKRWLTVPNQGSRLTIGPWAHTGRLTIRPFDVATEPAFDHDAELLSFFDAQLRGRPIEGPPVRYFTFVEQRWKGAQSWPPKATERVLHLASESRLLDVPEASAGHDDHRETGRNGTGERSRWRSLLSLVAGDYPDRAYRDGGLCVYDSEPLPRAIEVTGHPIAELFVALPDASDGHVFVYLEDVAPDGRVAYVTEGQLRALHRRIAAGPTRTPVPQHSYLRADAAPIARGEVAALTIDLLPISWLFEAGHRVRVAIAGADADHFAVMAPRTIRLHRGASTPSRIILPIVGLE